MGLEDLFDRYPTVPRVLDYFIKTMGLTSPLDEVAKECRLTKSEVSYALDVLDYFGLIEKHDEETEYFYSLSDSKLANKLAVACCEINTIKIQKGGVQ